MNKARYEELMADVTLYLTKEEVEEGWHFCFDWDGLLVHKDQPEAQGCCCMSRQVDKYLVLNPSQTVN